MPSIPLVTPIPNESTNREGRADGQRQDGGVLVVDDSESICSMLEAYFTGEGVRCWSAGNGAEAVKIFQERCSDIRLVLLDVQMPEVDGPSALVQMKNLQPDIACYFMSGDCTPYSQDDLLTMGARGVVPKPFSIDILPGLLKSALL